MRLTGTDKDIYRVVTGLIIALIIVVSAATAIFAGLHAAHNVRSELTKHSETIAFAVDEQQILKLHGKASDATTSTYANLKTRLANIKRTDNDIRSIYITGERANRLFFYVDSEKANTQYYSPAGEYYDEATPAFKGIFTTGKSIVEGPTSDSYGTFISGLAPVRDMQTGKVVAVIGIDYTATTYYQDIIQAVVAPALTGLGLVVILGIFDWIRRRNRQLLTVRSELVSVASHELRTPITGIRWAAETLRNMVSDEHAKPMIQAIYNSALSLQASTDDILELTHAMKEQKSVFKPADLTKMVRDIIQTQELAAQEKEVAIVIDSSWPDILTVNCDAAKLKRALQNILSNAIKYTRPQTQVTLRYAQTDKEHHILIGDEGIGIPEDEKARVFHGFYRASNAVATKIPGTGLGLYLVKTVIEQQHGHVSFASEENRGTVFTISLPK